MNSLGKMKKVNISIIVSLALIFLLSTAFTAALGISPADKKINFEPNTNVEIEFNIINSEQNDFEVSLSVMGDLQDIIFFEKRIVKLESDLYRVPFKVIFKFPSEMEPGIHKDFIKMTPLISGAGDNLFAAYISMKIPVYIRVPYPAKYMDVFVNIPAVDEGTPLPVFIKFDNLGSEDITRAWAEIELYDYDDNLLEILRTKEISVNTQTIKEVKAEPNPVLRKGMYSALVKAHYDENIKQLEVNFSVGKPVVRIRELITEELVRDEINKVVFKAYNDWSTELFVRGFIQINNRKNEMPVFTLKPEEEKKIIGFFDTTGFETGEYNLTITLIYADQAHKETFLVKVIDKKIIKPKPLTVLLLLGLLIIVIIIIILLIIKKRKIPDSETFK